MPYQPFIDDPSHIRALNQQRFVVLRTPALSAAYAQVQESLRERLRGLPVSYPARGHVTLCGFAAGTSLGAVQELVRSWAMAVPRLRVETVRVSSFPSPFQTVIVEVRKTQALFSALADLRARAEHGRFTVSTIMPVEQWTFHMSVAYCSRLDALTWRDVTQFAEALQVASIHDDLNTAEVVAFDEGREYSGGVYAFGATAAETNDRGGVSE